MNLEFFMPMDPPTATAQEKQIKIIHGKPIFYEPTNVKIAHAKLLAELLEHKPEKPITGPVELNVIWRFPTGTRHKDGDFKTTKPDTDNLQKMLKDCMTELGFWKDDAQVCRECVMKLWTDAPTGIAIGIQELPRSVYNMEVEE